MTFSAAGGTGTVTLVIDFDRGEITRWLWAPALRIGEDLWPNLREFATTQQAGPVRGLRPQATRRDICAAAHAAGGRRSPSWMLARPHALPSTDGLRPRETHATRFRTDTAAFPARPARGGAIYVSARYHPSVRAFVAAFPTGGILSRPVSTDAQVSRAPCAQASSNGGAGVSRRGLPRTPRRRGWTFESRDLRNRRWRCVSSQPIRCPDLEPDGLRRGLAVVIGRTGTRIRRRRTGHVAGYTVVNDVTARGSGSTANTGSWAENPPSASMARHPSAHGSCRPVALAIRTGCVCGRRSTARSCRTATRRSWCFRSGTCWSSCRPA